MENIDYKIVKDDNNNVGVIKPSVNGIMNVQEQLVNLKKLMKDILENSEFETKEKNKFDTHMLLKYDGLVIRKIIYLVLDKPNRNKNFKKAVDILAEFQKVKDGELELEQVLQNQVRALDEEYIYPKFGGKEEFEKKFKNQ